MTLSSDRQHTGHISSALTIDSYGFLGYRKLEYLYGLVEHHVAKATQDTKSSFSKW